jgi:hypothetical protein
MEFRYFGQGKVWAQEQGLGRVPYDAEPEASFGDPTSREPGHDNITLSGSAENHTFFDLLHAVEDMMNAAAPRQGAPAADR